MNRNLAKLLALLPAMLLLNENAAPLFSKDDKPAPVFKYAAWKEVESFSAEATAVDHGWRKSSKDGSWLDTDHYTAVRYKFDLVRKNISKSPPRNAWFWDVENCQAQGESIHHSNGADRWHFGESHYRGSLKGPVIKGGALRIDFDSGKYDIITEGLLQQPFHETGHIYSTDYGKVTNNSDIDSTEKKIPGISIQGNLEAATHPGVIVGSTIQDKPDPNGTNSYREYHVTMWPNYRDVECVVEIDKYEKWLPAANLKLPNLPGSRMRVDAFLQPKGGGNNQTIRARKFRFELAGVSHEPGVAMNFPQLSSSKEDVTIPDDPNPDLRLAAWGQPGELHNNDQEAVLKPVANARGQDSATVMVNAFDFGGYADLKVVCELEDGRELAGVLHTASDGDLVNITVPKRAPGTKIADIWREKYNLGPNDADDQDDQPDGDSNRGDGFSNFEEYRGFVIGGSHIRTNPTRKDLFIRNRIGSVAEYGLSLFRQDTELAVHFRTGPEEMPPSRAMNQNRSTKSPRSTKEFQHGLVLVWTFSGDVSYANVTKSLWRPKNVEDVRILWSVAYPPPDFNRDEKQDKELAVTIAHELCHSIGVKHHGDIDLGMVTWLRRSIEVNGTTMWWFEERKAEWNDADGKYITSPKLGNQIHLFADPKTEILPDNPGDCEFPCNVWVGVYGGQHSGNEQCIMRYDCSQAYRLPGDPRSRYLSPGEPVGTDLCIKPAGTGINAPSANPSRYSDATVGDCAHWFAVRDDAPERQPDKKPAK